MFFFFNDTATTEIYTLSLHDALPIFCTRKPPPTCRHCHCPPPLPGSPAISSNRRFLRRPSVSTAADRKSTRLNSSHANISYAVFCLKKKKNNFYPQSECLHP